MRLVGVDFEQGGVKLGRMDVFSVFRSDYYLYFDDFFVVAGLRVNHKRVVLEFVS